MRISWGAALVVAMLCACGSVDENNPDGGGDDAPMAGDFGLSIDPSSLTLTINTSATATVAVTRNGSIGDVTLSTPDLPTNLLVEFSQNPVPEGVDSVEATIVAVGGMPAATNDVTISGTSGSNTHTATLSVTTEGINVSGTIRGARQGVRVGIVGKGSILSGVDGAFSFSDVVPPYNLYTVAPDNSSSPTPTMNYFAGLTRTDPVVTAGITATGTGGGFSLCGLTPQNPCPTAPITGTRSGVGAGNTSPIVILWSANRGVARTIASDNTYSLTGSWTTIGSESRPGYLHGLQYTEKANGAPNQFIGYGRSNPISTLTNNSARVINLPFVAVGSSGNASGTITPVAGFPAPQITLSQDFTGLTFGLWSTTTSLTVDANFPIIPNAGGSNIHVTQTMGTRVSQYVYPLTQSADVSFTMLTPPEFVVPAAATGGITTGTPFVWTAAPRTISQSQFSCPGAVYRVFTQTTETTIPANPDLPLPANAACTWSITTYGPNEDMNDAAAVNELETVSQSDFAGPAHAVGLNSGRTFTTQ